MENWSSRSLKFWTSKIDKCCKCIILDFPPLLCFLHYPSIPLSLLYLLLLLHLPPHAIFNALFFMLGQVKVHDGWPVWHRHHQ